ncbi:transposase [Pseudomonas putida B6-2]|nr:transposase [Pseudomonas putida B6-2]
MLVIMSRYMGTRMRSMKCNPKRGLPRLFDRPKHQQHNIIERMSG